MESSLINPITLEIDNVQVTLKTVQLNKVYKCNCEDHSIKCHLKHQLSVHSSGDALIATEATFNVRNTSGKRWPIQVTNWELVDTDGYAYKARALCDALRPPPTIEPTDSLLSAKIDSHVTPGTQVDFVLVFPELEKDKEIACILFSKKGMLRAFEIKELNPEAIDLIQALDLMQALEAAGTEISEVLTHGFRSGIVSHHMGRLKRDIHSRLNKNLARNHAIKLENSIKEIAFEIELDLKSASAGVREAIEKELRDTISAYESELEKIKAQEEERKKLDQKIEQLSQLSATEFEEWVADLLIELGYEKVTLTPSSNDGGIDILAEKEGLKVAVQCKKWKGKVGSPEIQTFLGAMQHAGAKSGLLVTTGLFTISAEKMASDYPIELIDQIALTDLIQKALQK